MLTGARTYHTLEHRLYRPRCRRHCTVLCAHFPDSSVGEVQHAPADYPDGKEGDLLTVEFTVFGIPYIGLSGGPTFNHNEAFSFQVCTKVQAETDKYRTAIVDNGRQESADGARINGGVSWQITSAA